MNLYLENTGKGILITFLLLIGSMLYAQNNSKITIKKKNISLQTALADIREQTKMSVSYNSSQLPKTRISLDINNQSLDQALKTILAGTGFTYTVKDTYIMIIPEQTAKKSKSRNVAGNVVDGKGAPLIGVTVVEKGTGNGTVTNMEGNYHITTQGATPVLVFSYIGYQSKEIVVKENTINIVLEDESQALDEVVVTALGIKRAEKALSYNVQTVSNSELTVAKDANFMNSLNGKVAGVNIQKSSSGVGGATRVIMRGSKSIVGNNNALYVVDGMPIGNPSRGVIQTEYGAVAGSESISDFNPDDIESISVLTGPSAAALYGAAAANGVILINTARGGLIDDQALAEALVSGKVAAAGLDCVEDENLEENPLAKMSNVILTPHMGGTSNDLADEMIPKIASQIKMLAEVGKIQNIVNQQYLQK